VQIAREREHQCVGCVGSAGQYVLGHARVAPVPVVLGGAIEGEHVDRVFILVQCSGALDQVEDGLAAASIGTRGLPKSTRQQGAPGCRPAIAGQVGFEIGLLRGGVFKSEQHAMPAGKGLAGQIADEGRNLDGAMDLAEHDNGAGHQQRVQAGN